MSHRCMTAVVVLALAGLGNQACSHEERDPNGPGGGTGSTQTIGAAGGSVEATLDDGSTMSLTVPAGALLDPIAITLEPRPIGAGELTAFSLSPAGVRLAHPATLEIKLDDPSGLAATSVVVFEQNGLRIPVKSTPSLATGSISVSLDLLGVPALAAGPAPGRKASAGFFASSGGTGNGSVQNLTSSQRAQDAAAALSQLQSIGTVPAAEAMQLVMDAFIGLDASPQSDPLFGQLVTGWRTAVCADFQFATNAMNSFNFNSDYAGLERVMGDMVGWSLAVNAMTGTLALVSEAGCSGGLPDPETAVDAKLAILIPAINTDLNSFALLPSPQDSIFLTDRLRPLLNLATSFSLIDFTNAVNSITSLMPAQAVRLRDAGYADCLAGNKQSIQGRLIRLEALQGVFTAISPYAVGDLENDIELCGMQVTWALEDTRGGALGGSLLGGGDSAGLVQPVGAAEISGEGLLRFSGNLNALRCPAGLSSNNEQLEVQAGRSLGSLTTVKTLTPSNNDTYLQVSPLDVDIADVRSAAGMSALDTGTVQVVLTRTGGDCGGQFATLVHSPIGTIALHYFGPSLTDSWTGTVIMSGSPVPIVVNLAQSSTSVGGQYVVLRSVAGPAGGFSATYDGIRLTDISMGVDSLCGPAGGGYTATNLFVTATSISGTLAASGCAGTGTADLSLTRRNATVIGGPLSGIWSGSMDVTGLGTSPVFTRFIQSDSQVDGTWGGSGNFGRFSGTLNGSSFTFTGTDDAAACTLNTSGTMLLVAPDSLTFTGTGTNCHGSFGATGFATPGLP